MSPRPVSEQFTGRGFFCCFVVLFSRADARDTMAAGSRAAGRGGRNGCSEKGAVRRKGGEKGDVIGRDRSAGFSRADARDTRAAGGGAVGSRAARHKAAH